MYYLLFCILAGAGLVHLARRERSKPATAARKAIPTRNEPWVWWARYLIVLFVAGVLLALSGCVGRTGDEAKPEAKVLDPYLYRDRTTGCEYLAAGSGGLTPRMDRDGKQVCK